VFLQGGIYRYSYLWLREYNSGEESGRKSRPVCLIFRNSNGRLFIVPITTKEPPLDRIFLEVPRREWKQAGLTAQSWVILDEFNSTFENQSYDFTSIDPIGRFSDDFLKSLRERLSELIKARRARDVPRS
jgi:hypothetical protein